jgi:hypoxanthine phosphoribosyltransferase
MVAWFLYMVDRKWELGLKRTPEGTPYVERVLVPETELDEILDGAAEWINKEYDGCNEVFVAPILVGALPIAGELNNRITVPGYRLTPIMVRSYNGTQSSRQPQLVLDFPDDIAGKHVLLLEDIVDTGHTLAFLQALLRERGVGTLKTFALLDKEEAREVPVEVNLIGKQIPSVWVEGFGLDTDGLNRGGKNITFRDFSA